MSNKKGKKEFLDIKDPRTSIESLRITKEAQKPKIVRMEQSSLLERARLFLPQIAEANSKLASLPKEKINIENIDSNQSGVIKMDLGLGVFNLLDNNTKSLDDELIIPNKENDLLQPKLGLNIMLNPSDLPDDYSKPLIEMLAESDESTDSEDDNDLSSDSDNDSNSDDSIENDDDFDSEDNNSNNNKNESMEIENHKKFSKNKDIVMEDINNDEDINMEN
eukprot:jgi/Orpsp1_1/1186644/evm.model.d7180000052199.1